MKHISLKNKLEKAGHKVLQGKNGRTNFFYCNGSEYVVSWYKYTDIASCVQVRRHNDHNDSMSDYSAGFFPTTIKLVLKYISKI